MHMMVLSNTAERERKFQNIKQRRIEGRGHRLTNRILGGLQLAADVGRGVRLGARRHQHVLQLAAVRVVQRLAPLFASHDASHLDPLRQHLGEQVVGRRKVAVLMDAHRNEK